MKIKSSILLFSLSLTLTSYAEQNRIVGYYTSWSIYARNYHVPNIPPDEITHINYAFANINGSTNTIMLGDPYADIDKYYPGDSWEPDSLRGCFHQLLILKANHPHVKTLISVGGWTWSIYFSNVALTPQTRNTFARSAMEFITEYGFDGVDIDWEYPVSGGMAGTIHRPEDRQNYTLLMQELRRQLDSLETANNQEYLLTIAAPANPDNIANIEVAQIHQYLDWINIMTYDFHGPWGGTLDPVTNFNSPLYMAPEDPLPEPYHSQFNLSAAAENYLDLTLPPSKINAGLAFYGRGFGNVTNANNGLFVNYNGPCWQGTWEAGVFDFYDLKQNYINMAGYNSYWHAAAKVPWLHNPSAGVIISYDDTVSIGEKGDYILDEGLSGAMFWEFSADRDSTLLGKIARTLEDSLNVTIRCINTLAYPWWIVMPGGGGTLQYNLKLANNTDFTQTTQLWIIAKLPSGHWTLPLLGPVNLRLPPHTVLQRMRSQNVPGYAMEGTYEYAVRIGNYPDTIVDSHSFLFGKSGTDNGNFTGWENCGEDLVRNENKLYSKTTPLEALFFPAPFAPNHNIKFTLSTDSEVSIVLYNIKGEEITELNRGFFTQGTHFYQIQAISNLSSGIYFVKIRAGNAEAVVKMMLVK